MLAQNAVNVVPARSRVITCSVSVTVLGFHSGNAYRDCNSQGGGIQGDQEDRQQKRDEGQEERQGFSLAARLPSFELGGWRGCIFSLETVAFRLGLGLGDSDGVCYGRGGLCWWRHLVGGMGDKVGKADQVDGANKSFQKSPTIPARVNCTGELAGINW